ncbi:MAG: dihydroorotate dehydrogenase electron transfer subunit [Oscillospiraceae bacterium]|nr:dihydroorotate dehydrogenase electron transfer subunit [Oscillospiraceae bacterium]
MAITYQKALITANEQMTDTVFLLKAQWSAPTQPGQFFMLRTWDKAPLLSRPISVHNWENGIVEFLYEVRGTGTDLLSQAKAGDFIELTGALGKGFPVENISGKVAVVSGGIGIAPLYYVVRALVQKGCTVDFYCGFRDKPYGLEKFEALCSNVYLATDSGNYGVKGFVTDLLQPEGYDAVLTCGPEIMMEKIAHKAMAAGTAVYVSKESHMACGIGACLACTCKTKGGPKSVCKDGPVFKGEDIYADC